jgi:hypothetical protein
MFFERCGSELRFNDKRITDCYRFVNDAIRRVLNEGKQPAASKVAGRSAALFNSPPLGRAAYDLLVSGKDVPDDHVASYFADVPSPHMFRELDDSELSRFIDLFGLDIMRANFLSAHLVGEQHHQPLISGGACALETWATRLLSKPRLKNAPELRQAVLLKLLENAPYYTHITGAMMLGAKTQPQIMYDETFPWFMAIHDIGEATASTNHSWSLDNVRGNTRELYDRIHDAIVRRSHLVSDEAPEILRVPFEDLKLDEAGYLESWYQEYISELPEEFSQYVPKKYQCDKFIGAYVRYTYVGPDLLKLLKQYLKSSSYNIDQFTIHVRTKQDDHLYEGSRINRILLKGIHGDDHNYLRKYANICNLSIYFWHQQHWRSNNAFIGFSDLSFRGNIVHDTINLHTGSNGDIRTEEELWDIVSCPLRLNRNNIEEHFNCLDKYTDEVYIYEEAILELKNIKRRLNKHQKKAGGAQARSLERELIVKIIGSLSSCRVSGHPSVFIENDDISRALGGVNPKQVEKELSDIPNRYKRKSKIAEIDNSENLLNTFKEYVSVDRSGEGLYVRLTSFSPELRLLLAILADVIQDELNEYQRKNESEQQLLNKAHGEYASALSLVEHVSEDLLDFSRTKPHLFPLRDNLIFCHAMQLSFDPNIALFLLDVEEVESSQIPMKEKRRLLINASRLILPRIKCYLQIVMSENENPDWLESLGAYSPVLLNNTGPITAKLKPFN